jgi:acylpyruvate hydrolase
VRHTEYLHRDHIKELNSARPKQPFFFLKPTSSVLLPGEGPVIRPRGVDLHYEVELALIMGKEVKDLSPDDDAGALSAIESMFYTPIRARRAMQ